jgi:hypothetical protein
LEAGNYSRGGSRGNSLLQTNSQRSKIVSQTDTTLNQRGMTPALGKVWPEGQIPYWIDDVNDEDDAASAGYSGVFTTTNMAILTGIANYEAKTCLRFRKCETRAECQGLGSFIPSAIASSPRTLRTVAVLHAMHTLAWDLERS